MDNKDKMRRIDQILKDLYASVKEDKINLDKDMVYQYLIFMDVSLGDRRFELDNGNYKKEGKRNFFKKWIDRYKSIENIDVYCAPNWKCFCQFRNGKVNAINCIKIYVPLDYNHIYEGANKIFDFLAQENISHRSKIAKKVRFDDIVIRVNTKEDAEKIQNFIDNDSYIKEGMIKSSPFAFEKNGCIYAYDRTLSYNECLSKIICYYINEMSKNSKFSINDVNANNFFSWLNNISDDLEMISIFSPGGYAPNICLQTYFIINLIKLSFCSNDIKDFYKYVAICNDVSVEEKVRDCFRKKEKKLSFASLVNDNNSNYDLSNDDVLEYDFFDDDISNENEFNKDKNKVLDDGFVEYDFFDDNISNKNEFNNNKIELFNELILTTMKKYPKGYDNKHPNYSGFDYILTYLNDDIRGVTKDNDLGSRVEKELRVQDVYEIVDSSGIPGKDINQQLYNYIKVVMLNNVISMMKIRFPNSYLSNINRFIETNNKKYITNSVGQARQIVCSLDSNVIKQLFLDLGVNDIYEYEKYYYGESNGRKLS